MPCLGVRLGGKKEEKAGVLDTQRILASSPLKRRGDVQKRVEAVSPILTR